MPRLQWGKDNPAWIGGKVEFSCERCGKKFFAYQSERDRGGAKYCSGRCGYDNKTTRVELACEQCGRSFLRTKSDASRKRQHRFCSKVCAGLGFSKYLSGENNAHFGEVFSDEHRAKISASESGEKHYRWRGGVKKSREGYRLIRTEEGKVRYRPEHRIVAEKALGRLLKEGEVVHHINGDKGDNRNTNLVICERGYHQWLHRKMSNRYMTEHFADSVGGASSV